MKKKSNDFFRTLILLSFVFVGSLFSQDINKKIYKVAVLNDWKPYYSTDEKGAPSGYAIEIFDLIAKKADIEYEYVVVNEWKDIFKLAQNNEADIVPNMGISKDRSDLFTFTHPTDIFEISLFKRKATQGLYSIDDLTDKKVGVVEKNICGQLIVDEMVAKKELYGSFERAFNALITGEIEVLCYPKPLVHTLATSLDLHHKIEPFGEPLLEVQRGIAIAVSEMELLPKFNEAIKQMKEEKGCLALHKKYFGHKIIDLTFKQIVTVVALTTIAFVSILFLLWRKKILVTQKELTTKVEQTSSFLKDLQLKQIKNLEKSIFGLVSIIESRDTYTAGHSLRVASYARVIASEYGLDQEECQKIYNAGLLHDIGKVGIPDSVLLKPQSFSDTDFQIIQEHVNFGIAILKESSLFEELGDIIQYHHERVDGSGYPKGYKGEEIPLTANILAVADCFDAMTTTRIYKKAKTKEQALMEIKQLSGVHFFEDIIPSAIEALSRVNIDDTANQLPKNMVEKERFAFFYKDQLTGLYNAYYLDILLQNNDYKFATVVMLKNFQNYNKKFGWDSGDSFLVNFSQLLVKEFGGDTLIFRIFGDDFVILSNTSIEIESAILENFCKKRDIYRETFSYDIKKCKIDTLAALETNINNTTTTKRI